jgi:anti-sigma regulatory factor (Ser/Thr protein kinase)/CheY-like chemotaxis protein
VLVSGAAGDLPERLAGTHVLAGFEISRADTHVETLQRLLVRDATVVLIVAAGPARDQLPFVQEIRSIRPGAKMILLTTTAPPADLIDALRARVFVCFTTPFELDELATMVHAAATQQDWREGIEVVSGLPNWITLRVSSRLVTAERLMRFFTEYLADVADAERQKLTAALREILLNAMEHGAGFDPDKIVEVSAARTTRAIVYHVRDPGPGFKREALAHAAVANASADPLAHLNHRAELGMRPGGFGMLLTRDLVDEMVYNERGNEVILIKYLDR